MNSWSLVCVLIEHNGSFSLQQYKAIAANKYGQLVCNIALFTSLCWLLFWVWIVLYGKISSTDMQNLGQTAPQF